MQTCKHLNRLGRAVATTALFCMGVLPATTTYADGYLGKVCLLSTVTARETGPVTEPSVVLTYEANNLGGSTYALTGSVNMPSGPFIFTGFGHVLGNIMYMNLTTTQSHADGWRDTAVQQAQLNLATFTGTFYENGQDYNPTTKQWDNRYTAGNFTKTACP